MSRGARRRLAGWEIGGRRWLGGKEEASGVGQAQKQRGGVATDLGDGMENSGGDWGGSLGNSVRSKMD